MLCFPEVFQQIRIALVKLLFESGFYLGYLRGRSFPSPPQKNIVISTVNYIGKIIQTRRGQCTHCNISQNCLKMHQIASQRIFIPKNFRGACPGPIRKLVAFGYSGRLPQTISPRFTFLQKLVRYSLLSPGLHF